MTDIMDLRRYRKSYWDVKRAKGEGDVDEWGKHWVFEVQAALLEERRNR